jgi:hypothetical protein
MPAVTRANTLYYFDRVNDIADRERGGKSSVRLVRPDGRRPTPLGPWPPARARVSGTPKTLSPVRHRGREPTLKPTPLGRPP